MFPAPCGIGIQSVFSVANPTFVWDAFRAGRSIGKGIEGNGHMLVTPVDLEGPAAAQNFVFSDSKWRLQPSTMDTQLGLETGCGPAGEFYFYTTNFFTSWAANNLGFDVVSPTTSSSWAQLSGVKPDILHSDSSSGHADVTEVDTDVDAVNDVVIERSTSKSMTYAREFRVFVKSLDSADISSSVFLKASETSGERDAAGGTYKSIPGSDWVAVSLIVPAGVSTTNYITIRFVAGTGSYQFACPTFASIFSGHENITRFSQQIISTDRTNRLYIATDNAELQLRRSGWIAMSLILPAKGVDNGYTNYSGSAEYSFSGYLNLECGTDRLRIFMSNTYNYVAVGIGDTAGAFYSYLGSQSESWLDFAPIGLVATWGGYNRNRFATLYVNGLKRGSSFNPVDHFSDNNAPGTMYIGISGSGGTSAEAWIPRVAYGNTPMHPSQARTLSVQYRNLAMERGGSELGAWNVYVPPEV